MSDLHRTAVCVADPQYVVANEPVDVETASTARQSPGPGRSAILLRLHPFDAGRGASQQQKRQEHERELLARRIGLCRDRGAVHRVGDVQFELRRMPRRKRPSRLARQ